VFGGPERLMGFGSVRVLVIAAVSAFALSGCGTAGLNLTGQDSADPQTRSTGADDPSTTGTIAKPGPVVVGGPTPISTGLSGEEPNDDLSLGKKYYRQNSFGLAEQHFRRAAEQSPRDLEAWIGLAAAYDKLKRFDLADRAYEQALRLAGPTPEILNNQGYSYLLRGDYQRARRTLLAARAKDPGNPFIQNNLDLLDEAFAKRKAVQ
jgi:tetratricopeptide (TPR) repeat protein